MVNPPDKVKKVLLSGPMLVGYGLTFLVICLLLVAARQEICIEQRIPFFEECERRWTFLMDAPGNEFGDALAGFAGTLAFVWIVVTVFQQSVELSRQRAEFEEMNDRLGGQEFESTFNDLLSSFFNLRDTIHFNFINHLGEIKQTVHGSEALLYISDNLKSIIESEDDAPVSMARLHKGYEEFWRRYGRQLAPYFRFLFNMFRFIDESNHSEKYHSRFLRSILSEGELVLLLYNARSSRGEPFMRYMMKYSVLDNLELESLNHGTDILLLPREVYGENRLLLEGWDDAAERYGTRK